MNTRVKIPCPLCNSDKSFDLTNLFSSKNMPVCICKRCSLVYLNPRYSDNWYKNYYKSSSERDKDSNRLVDITAYENKQYEVKGKSVLRYILSNCDVKVSQMKVLEIGCTSGGILRYFREKGAASVTGVDPESRYAEYANRVSGINVYDGYFDEFCKYNKETYNMIIMRHVVEHLFEPLVNLELVNSLLDENGILFVETPSLYSMGIRERWKKNFIVEHPVIYSVKTLELLIEKCRFKIIKRPENGNRTHLRFLAKKHIIDCVTIELERYHYSWQKVVLKSILYDLITPLRKFYYDVRSTFNI